MRFVIDASIAASWCFDDEHSAIAERAAADLLDGSEAISLIVFWFEIRNVVLMGLRRKRTTPELMARSLDRLALSPITASARLPDERPVLSLAQRHNLTFYDACYLELALREQLPLATLDKRLAAAATAAKIALLG